MTTIHLGDCMNGCSICAENHNWVCSDIPGVYVCECGAEGYWDREEMRIVA